ncbi:hypothetical protein KSP39_PZI017811 [Platanthera zijinensis]|uniref:Uncharacterized protein n=1 Tax=Platanthera zijinensis TaxID=2320716 RepID=A0AAP0B4R7_9ASPA
MPPMGTDAGILPFGRRLSSNASYFVGFRSVSPFSTAMASPDGAMISAGTAVMSSFTGRLAVAPDTNNHTASKLRRRVLILCSMGVDEYIVVLEREGEIEREVRRRRRGEQRKRNFNRKGWSGVKRKP